MERMCIEQKLTENLADGNAICCHLVPMGQDLTLCVSGGDRPHIGSVVMSVARPSLTGQGVGVTSFVLNGIGHKDEYVARKFAEALAKKYHCTAVCTCGIHIDGITEMQLKDVSECCDRLLEQLTD